MKIQNTRNYIRALFLDVGYVPTDNDVRAVVESLTDQQVVEADEFIEAMKPLTFIQVVEAMDLESEALDRVWEAFEAYEIPTK
jgi:Zn-dependent oligopeptidase